MMVELLELDKKIEQLGLPGVIQNAIKFWEDFHILHDIEEVQAFISKVDKKSKLGKEVLAIETTLCNMVAPFVDDTYDKLKNYEEDILEEKDHKVLADMFTHILEAVTRTYERVSKDRQEAM
jgi:hypothetical protein